MKRIEGYIAQYANDVEPLIINYKSRYLDTEALCDNIPFDSDVIDVATFLEEELIPAVKGEKKYSIVQDRSTYPKLCILQNFQAVLDKEITAEELFWVLRGEFSVILIVQLGQTYEMPFKYCTYIDEYEEGVVSDYFHVVCDTKEYLQAGIMPNLPFHKEDMANFDFHMEIEPYAEMSLRAKLLAFINNYDGLYMEEGDTYTDMMQKAYEDIINAREKGRKIVLWHKQEGEQMSFRYIASLVKADGRRESIYEGLNLADCLEQYECAGANLCEKEFVEKYAREILVSETSTDKIDTWRYDSFDQMILQEFEKSDAPVSPKKVVEKLSAEHNLWYSFLNFRLAHLRDKGLLKVVKKELILQTTQPQMYCEEWVRNYEPLVCDAPYDYDMLKELLHRDCRGWEEDMYLDTLLHELPITTASLEFIESCMEAPIARRDKEFLIACCLIRLRDLLTDEDFAAWRKRFVYLD